MADKTDIEKLQGALANERGVSKTLKTDLLAAQSRIRELETLGANPDAAQVQKFIADAVLAGVGAKTVESHKRIQELEAALGDSKKSADDANAKFASRAITDDLREAARANFVKPEAMSDVLAIGASALKLVDGEVRTDDGKTAAQWLEDRKAVSGYWWPAARGSGARGSQPLGMADAADNPFAAGSFNLTKQGQLITENPARAEQLQRAAGGQMQR